MATVAPGDAAVGSGGGKRWGKEWTSALRASSDSAPAIDDSRQRGKEALRAVIRVSESWPNVHFVRAPMGPAVVSPHTVALSERHQRKLARDVRALAKAQDNAWADGGGGPSTVRDAGEWVDKLLELQQFAWALRAFQRRWASVCQLLVYDDDVRDAHSIAVRSFATLHEDIIELLAHVQPSEDAVAAVEEGGAAARLPGAALVGALAAATGGGQEAVTRAARGPVPFRDRLFSLSSRLDSLTEVLTQGGLDGFCSTFAPLHFVPKGVALDIWGAGPEPDSQLLRRSVPVACPGVTGVVTAGTGKTPKQLGMGGLGGGFAGVVSAAAERLIGLTADASSPGWLSAPVKSGGASASGAGGAGHPHGAEDVGSSDEEPDGEAAREGKASEAEAEAEKEASAAAARVADAMTDCPVSRVAAEHMRLVDAVPLGVKQSAVDFLKAVADSMRVSMHAHMRASISRLRAASEAPSRETQAQRAQEAKNQELRGSKRTPLAARRPARPPSDATVDDVDADDVANGIGRSEWALELEAGGYGSVSEAAKKQAIAPDDDDEGPAAHHEDVLQVMLAAAAAQRVVGVEAAMASGSLALEFKIITSQLRALGEVMRGLGTYGGVAAAAAGVGASTSRRKLTAGDRHRLACLMTADIHMRDVVAEMLRWRGAVSALSGVWAQQVKHRWHASAGVMTITCGDSPLADGTPIVSKPDGTGVDKPPPIEPRSVTGAPIWRFVHGGEFMGATRRLLLTPVTQRIAYATARALAGEGPDRKAGCVLETHESRSGGIGTCDLTAQLACTLGKWCHVERVSVAQAASAATTDGPSRLAHLFEWLSACGWWGTIRVVAAELESAARAASRADGEAAGAVGEHKLPDAHGAGLLEGFTAAGHVLSDVLTAVRGLPPVVDAAAPASDVMVERGGGSAVVRVDPSAALFVVVAGASVALGGGSDGEDGLGQDGLRLPDGSTAAVPLRSLSGSSAMPWQLRQHFRPLSVPTPDAAELAMTLLTARGFLHATTLGNSVAAAAAKLGIGGADGPASAAGAGSELGSGADEMGVVSAAAGEGAPAPLPRSLSRFVGEVAEAAGRERVERVARKSTVASLVRRGANGKPMLRANMMRAAKTASAAGVASGHRGPGTAASGATERLSAYMLERASVVAALRAAAQLAVPKAKPDPVARAGAPEEAREPSGPSMAQRALASRGLAGVGSSAPAGADVWNLSLSALKMAPHSSFRFKSAVSSGMGGGTSKSMTRAQSLRSPPPTGASKSAKGRPPQGEAASQLEHLVPPFPDPHAARDDKDPDKYENIMGLRDAEIHADAARAALAAREADRARRARIILPEDLSEETLVSLLNYELALYVRKTGEHPAKGLEAFRDAFCNAPRVATVDMDGALIGASDSNEIDATHVAEVLQRALAPVLGWGEDKVSVSHASEGAVEQVRALLEAAHIQPLSPSEVRQVSESREQALRRGAAGPGVPDDGHASAEGEFPMVGHDTAKELTVRPASSARSSSRASSRVGEVTSPSSTRRSSAARPGSATSEGSASASGAGAGVDPVLRFVGYVRAVFVPALEALRDPGEPIPGPAPSPADTKIGLSVLGAAFLFVAAMVIVFVLWFL